MKPLAKPIVHLMLYIRHRVPARDEGVPQQIHEHAQFVQKLPRELLGKSIDAETIRTLQNDMSHTISLLKQFS